MQRSTHEPSAASAKGTSPQVATGDNEGASPQVATDVMGPAQSPRVLPDSWRASFSIGKTKSLPAEARTRNLALVLQTIYADGPLSRADLARATHLTKVTISDLVARLMDDGLVQEVGADQYLRPGKPAVLLDLVKDAFAVGCLDPQTATPSKPRSSTSTSQSSSAFPFPGWASVEPTPLRPPSIWLLTW